MEQARELFFFLLHEPLKGLVSWNAFYNIITIKYLIFGHLDIAQDKEKYRG